MKHAFLLTGIAALTLSTGLFAQETPVWLRKNEISPDGTHIAFSYKGDIYTVPLSGGRALQITSNNAYDSDPKWTPDSKKLYFSSYREGSKDIFLTGAEGGTPVRITDYPGNETPLAVLPDGQVIFSANIQNDIHYGGFPETPQLYLGGPDIHRPVPVTSLPVMNLSVNGAGVILFEDYKGYEDPLRKHHTSSVTRDIWMYRGSDDKHFTINGEGTFRKLTVFEGEDRNPVFGPDGDTFYYISEKGCKNLNLFRSSLTDPKSATQLTFSEKAPVRYLSVAKNGTVAYSLNGDLYVLENGVSRKLEISVVRDEVEKKMIRINFTSGSYLAPSPNGKEVAVIIRGDVFVTSEEFSTTRRITNTAEQERNLSFSKDGRELYYSSERDGNWGIWRARLKGKDEKFFTYGAEFEEELFSDKGETCFQPVVSPDGKWVAYLRDRTEIVIKPTEGGAAKSLLKGVNYSYSDGDQRFAWSPDSRYLLCNYQADGGWNNDDVALIEIESGKVTDLTQSGYSDGDFRWALGGKAMTWHSDRYGFRSHGSWGSEDDVMILFFDPKKMGEFNRDKEEDAIAKFAEEESKKAKKEEKKDSADKKKQKVEKLDLTLDGREYRIQRLTRASGRLIDHYLTEDGKKLFYIAPTESGMGLHVMDIKDRSVKVLHRGAMGRIVPSTDGKSLYIASSGALMKIPIAGGSPKRIAFSGEFEFKPAAEREYMFDHIWKQVQEKFYDPGLHGADWEWCRENYRRFLTGIDNYFDFQEMLSEMLGELNGSHTGARFRNANSVSLSHLGVLYDASWTGDGLKIAEVLPGGVLSLTDPEIKAGDVIEAIDGIQIKAGESWYALLTNKNGKKVRLNISKGGKKATDLLVKPGPSDYALLYRRWVRQREEMVEQLSGGKIGYVHVEGMDSKSFREVYSKALGKYRTCDALIVDTRHNGGGWLHDDLATFLNGKAYLHFQPRGQYIGTEPFSKWTKPSCVLMCEDNYSDACGFPYTYRTLGIGKLIGAPVPGTMTAVWWETQINGNIVFGIPQVGSFGLKEKRYLENMQIEPDILVYNDPASVLKGEDQQLKAAVEEMLRQTGNK